MDKADITKIAPTLSTKERIKLLISDWQKILAGEKSLLSDAEKTALMSFTKAEDFKEYEYFVGIYKWCGLVLWRDEIEKTFLRIAIGFQRIGRFGDLQETAQFLEKEIRELFEYKAAVEIIEKELDLPLFDERTYLRFRSYWSVAEDFLTKCNKLVGCIEPDKEVVAQMVADVKKLATSEVEVHEGIVEKVIEGARKLL